jgi:rhodanese-related sulfurtransferase
LRGIYYSWNRSAREGPMADAPRMAVDELKRRMDGGEDFTLIDVRNPQAWAESDTMLPEAIRVPLDKLETNIPRVPQQRPAVAYCTWPDEASSASLVRKLQDKGYKNVWALQGGFHAWQNAGFPVATKRQAA